MLWSIKDFDELKQKELYNLLKLRQEVFIVEQNCPYLDADDKDFEAQHILGLTIDGLVAYARIVPPEISYPEVSIGRFLTAPSVRGTGLGKDLMEVCFKVIMYKYGTCPIRISAQEYLTPFYSKYGFIDTGKHYLEDGIPHVEMLWEVRENQS